MVPADAGSVVDLASVVRTEVARLHEVLLHADSLAGILANNAMSGDELAFALAGSAERVHRDITRTVTELESVVAA